VMDGQAGDRADFRRAWQRYLGATAGGRRRPGRARGPQRRARGNPGGERHAERCHERVARSHTIHAVNAEPGH